MNSCIVKYLSEFIPLNYKLLQEKEVHEISDIKYRRTLT